MSIKVEINSSDLSDNIVWNTLKVQQNMTSKVDVATFTIRKYGDRTYTPQGGDEIEIFEGSNKIFGGEITKFNERVESGGGGVVYDIICNDHQFTLSNRLVSKSYANETIADIIDDIITNFAPAGFTTTNVTSTLVIEKIVFNQIDITGCIRRLADLVNYEWYVDPDKDIHFFQKFTNSAPFDLTDTSGNYIYKSLKRIVDSTQLVNQVVVRGAEYDGATYTDIITVKGNDSKSFDLPYRFSNLTVELDTGGGFVSQQIGIDNIDDFGASVDVLFNFAEKTIRWQSALSDGDRIRFSGNPKVPVLAVSEDAASKAEFGLREKLIRDLSIESLDVARRRAIAEIDTYKDEISDGSFKTYTSGLRSGMIINVDSDNRDIDINFLIKSVVFKTLTPEEFEYDVKLITTRRYGLTELLRNLFEPEPRPEDAEEVAEIIKTDFQTVTITELITAVSAVTDIQTVTITESISKDPLGADTAPIWVVADYIPSPWPTDTKRVGLVDREMQVYSV